MRLAAAAVVSLLLVGCSDDGGDGVVAGSGGGETSTGSGGAGAVSIDVDCGALAGDDRSLATSQELAFDGTVVATSVETNPEGRFRRAFVDDGAEDAGAPAPTEEQLGSPEAAEPWPWTTFEVHAWYTQDHGSQIAVWTAGLDVEVGERWLLAGEAFATPVGVAAPSGQSGMAAACASHPYTNELAATWDGWFGGSVVAGAGEPEGEADPAVVAAVEEGRARWEAQAPDRYAAVIDVSSGGPPPGPGADPVCGAVGPVVVVVSDGEVVAAAEERSGCTVDLRTVEVPTVDDLFDVALVAAAAVESSVSIDPTWGFVSGYAGWDRAVDMGGGVSWLAPGDHVVLANDAIAPALGDLEARWAAAGIDDYRLTLRPLCFCGLTDVVVSVRDGVGVAEQPEAADGLPLTVDGLFAMVAEEVASSDRVVAVFDAELGVPVRLYLDRIAMAIDDELTLSVVDFAATAAG